MFYDELHNMKEGKESVPATSESSSDVNAGRWMTVFAA